jgi:hypothetical protein
MRLRFIRTIRPLQQAMAGKCDQHHGAERGKDRREQIGVASGRIGSYKHHEQPKRREYYPKNDPTNNEQFVRSLEHCHRYHKRRHREWYARTTRQ